MSKASLYGRLSEAAIIAGRASGPLLPRHPVTGLAAIAIRNDGRPLWPVAGGNGNGTGTAQRSPFLQALYDERSQLEEFLDQTIQGAMTGGPDGGRRDLSATENETLNRTRARITAIDAQITPLEDYERMKANGDRAGGTYTPPASGAPGQPGAPGLGGAGGGAGAGRPGGGQQERTGLGGQFTARAHVYPTKGHAIVDQLMAAPTSLGGKSDAGARERLLSAGVIYAGVADADVTIARGNAQAEADRINAAAMDRMRDGTSTTQERAGQVTADTPGILPVSIIGEIMSDVDGARPFISSIGPQAMAFAGDSFKRPVITQHVQAGKQTTQLTGLASRKMVIGGVTFNKETWGDTLDISRQDIDWTSPSAWNAVLNDLEEQYGLETENSVADTFAAAITAQVEVAGTGAASTLKDYITAMYAAAALAYAGGGRLPDTVWASLDMWSTLGPLIEAQVAMQKNVGDTEVSTFEGALLRLPRYVVPSFPNGTLIIGVKKWTEVYEERIGLLQAVLPSVLGVQVAYGGYVAYNTLKAGAFAKVVNLV